MAKGERSEQLRASLIKHSVSTRGSPRPEERKLEQLQFFGYTLIAKEFVDVLSDKNRLTYAKCCRIVDKVVTSIFFEREEL